MMLGNGGNGLPRALSRDLPQVFCDTFGRWSAAVAPAHTNVEPAVETAYTTVLRKLYPAQEAQEMATDQEAG